MAQITSGNATTGNDGNAEDDSGQTGGEAPNEPPSIKPNGINNRNTNDNTKRKTTAPIPSPVPTSWANNADLTKVRANTPLGLTGTPLAVLPLSAPLAPPPPPQTNALEPLARPKRTKSDAGSVGKTTSAFKRMFSGGTSNAGSSSAIADDPVSALSRLSLHASQGANGYTSEAVFSATPVSERGDPIQIGIQPPTPVPPETPRAKPTQRNSFSEGRFTLKSLLNSEQKLSRKTSASSRKSDSSRGGGGDDLANGVLVHGGYVSGPESVGGGRPKSRGPGSTGGDSATTLSKKYGVCEKAAIGKGATSVVRLAHKWDRTEEKLYAVKEFRKRRKNESEREYVKKLTAEFCISSTLRHANIVETVDLVQDEHANWCEVMEYCPGGDLYAAIKRGSMSPSEVECSFKQILLGIEYLHSQGVAHRDIKPENLFFDAKGQLKIGDYGVATVYRLPWEATVHNSTGLVGSEPYIAPEQFTKQPYDARLVDIWACGVVYYCLHFQELPWRVAQPTEPLFASYVAATQSKSPSVAECPDTINNLSPRACRPLLRRMLEPKPEKRILIEEVMKDTWIDSIEVCYRVAKPNHIHVNARQMTSGGVV